MNIAIIGCGNIVIQEHIPAITSLNIIINGLCDISINNIYTAKKLINYEVPTFSCYKQLINVVKPTTLLLALPHATYYKILEYCSKFSIKIIKEKPFALTLSESKIFKNFCHKSPCKIFTVCQKRYTLAYQILKEQLNISKEKICYFNIRYNIPSKNPNAKWRSKYSTSGGGVWVDMGYHVLDIINYFFDDKAITINHTRLINSSNGTTYEVDDIAFVEFKCNDAIIHAYISCVAIEKHEDITIYSKDLIFYANKKQVIIKNKKQRIINSILVDNISPFKRMYQEFFFDFKKENFKKNLKKSISLTKLLEQVFKTSQYSI